MRKTIIFRCTRCERIWRWGKWFVPEGQALRDLILNEHKITYLDRLCGRCEKQREEGRPLPAVAGKMEAGNANGENGVVT
jgi:hypothetical protein